MSLIYVLEDDKSIREIEEYALTASSYAVQGFETAEGLRKALKERVPDLLLLDIMLPDADGCDVLEELRENRETEDLPVIMVTAKSTELDKVRGLDLGADDYLTKPFGVLELISRVKARLRRKNTVNSGSPGNTSLSHQETGSAQAAGTGDAANTRQSGGESMRNYGEEARAFADGRKHLAIGGIVLDDDKYEVTSGGTPVRLTYKEYSLLRLLMDRAGSAVTRDEILDKVWDTNFAGESRTLDMHIRTLRKKLGADGERIRTLRNIGYTIDKD